ncbi:MAG: hypothetical protein FWD52_08845 [Candidatus Bathyarchaeota archaeon]|nr:hypothetical protein [Candidatus Termiticorpusculum sp.]
MGLEFPSDRPIIAELRTSPNMGGLVLYPYWFVELPLVYSPDLSMYAWQLSIWADTGEIASSHPVGGYGAVPDVADGSSNLQRTPSDTNLAQSEHNKNLLSITTIIIAMTIIIGLIAIAVFKKR